MKGANSVVLRGQLLKDKEDYGHRMYVLWVSVPQRFTPWEPAGRLGADPNYITVLVLRDRVQGVVQELRRGQDIRIEGYLATCEMRGQSRGSGSAEVRIRPCVVAEVVEIIQGGTQHTGRLTSSGARSPSTEPEVSMGSSHRPDVRFCPYCRDMQLVFIDRSAKKPVYRCKKCGYPIG